MKLAIVSSILGLIGIEASIFRSDITSYSKLYDKAKAYVKLESNIFSDISNALSKLGSNDDKFNFDMKRPDYVLALFLYRPAYDQSKALKSVMSKTDEKSRKAKYNLLQENWFIGGIIKACVKLRESVNVREVEFVERIYPFLKEKIDVSNIREDRLVKSIGDWLISHPMSFRDYSFNANTFNMMAIKNSLNEHLCDDPIWDRVRLQVESIDDDSARKSADEYLLDCKN